jgi:hypothetical protein
LVHLDYVTWLKRKVANVERWSLVRTPNGESRNEAGTLCSSQLPKLQFEFGKDAGEILVNEIGVDALAIVKDVRGEQAQTQWKCLEGERCLVLDDSTDTVDGGEVGSGGKVAQHLEGSHCGAVVVGCCVGLRGSGRFIL